MCMTRYATYLTHGDPDASLDIDDRPRTTDDEGRTVAEMPQPRRRPRPRDGDGDPDGDTMTIATEVLCNG